MVFKTNRSRTSLSLIELVLAILIFSLASGIVLQLFLGSRSLGQLSRDKNAALMKIQSIAEVFCAQDGDFFSTDFMQFDAKTTAEPGREICEAYYDKNWEFAAGTFLETVYVISVEITESPTNAGVLKNASIKARRISPYPFLDGQTEIMTLDAAVYVAR